MTLANDSHVGATAAAGTSFATHLISGKEHPVGVEADYKGHIHGSLPAYGLIIPPAAVGANKIFFDFFNAQASTVIRLRKLFAIVATDVAVPATVGVRLDVMRTTSAGTGGTAAVSTGASKTAAAFWGFNPSNPALAAGVTARLVPTGGATDGTWLFNAYLATEESQVTTGTSSAAAQLAQYYNLLPEMAMDQAIELPQNFGLKIVQGSVASVGNVGFLLAFTVEA